MIVASNLFGDILSDLAAAVAGSIGIAPSGNLNPERDYPSMFEPVHGSAPDIAGQGVANPIGAIWSAAMMLEHLGETDAADAVDHRDRRRPSRHGPRTPDLGGKASTAEVTAARDRGALEVELQRVADELHERRGRLADLRVAVEEARLRRLLLAQLGPAEVVAPAQVVGELERRRRSPTARA